RTPLREAMLGLEATGFLASDMGRGFMVPQISSEEFLQRQAMLAKMAPYALGLTQSIPTSQIMELSNLLGRAKLKINQDPAGSGSLLADLICRWTLLTISGCPNQMLVNDITRLDALARRCWNQAVLLGFDPATMLESYAALYELLRTQNRDAAAVHWENHITQYSSDAAQSFSTAL
ncbi:MAG: DNA-binding GntR family transcriptional regulator, partial [Candidatus Krumholzibacteriia bacterium]